MLSPSILQTLQYKLPHFQQRNMRKLANIARRVFGNSVQASYFERFHWSILNYWTLQTAEHAIPCSVAVMLHGLWCPKIQNWPMKTFRITSLHRVQSVRTCCEYTKTRRDKEIRGAQLQIDNFKWHLPVIYTLCLETIWNPWASVGGSPARALPWTRWRP